MPNPFMQQENTIMPNSIEFVTVAAILIEIAGVMTIVLGAMFAIIAAAVRIRKRLPERDIYRCFRRQLGRVILVGLEFLVAADIIRTVAVRPTFRSAGVLTIIVLVRTFLSFTLEVEMTGRWPWQSKNGEAER